MPWPSNRDYVKALEDTGLCFADSDLVDGEVDRQANGEALAKIGNSASIFRVVKNEKAWAVKCFHWHTDEHQKRYDAIQKTLEANKSRFFIQFQYIKQGIKAAGAWYPIVKMEWVEGETLESYILNNIQFPSRLENVKKDFKELLAFFDRHKLAHLDLQHGNLMIYMDKIRLVDYDCFYVPQLHGQTSLELGHQNYQHPRRLKSDYGPHMDNFSAWVIYASLQCLVLDTTLWHKLAGGDDCLLFRQEDFGDPFSSYTFSLLESHNNLEIRNISKMLRSLCDTHLLKIPTINEALASPINLKPLPPINTAPAWLNKEKVLESAQAGNRSPALSKGLNYASTREFNDAVRDPAQNFLDLELRNSFCCLEDTIAGKNSRIYHFIGKERELAVKCFTFHAPDREKHYQAIKTALQGRLREFTAQIHYLPQGIKVNNEWYPILKMEWLKGQTLSQLNRGSIPEPMASFLADRFADMLKTFRACGIAHGDLNFDNIMLVGQDLKVVDYDGMYVPELIRCKALETGTPAFQHPERNTSHFGPYIDNFSAWLIHYFLKHLWSKPHLNQLVDACLADERQTSTVKKCLRALELDREEEIKEMGQLLRLLLSHKANATPYLDSASGFRSALKAQTQIARENTSSASPFLKRKPKQ
jgi:serine/threonine protein kinase